MHIKLNLTLLIIISASSRASRHARSIMKTKESGPTMVQPNLEPEIPEHCRNHSFCEDVPNYPYEYIDYLLENNETVRKALFLLKNRLGGAAGCKKDNDGSVEICESEMKYVQAKAAQVTNGTWNFLVGKPGLCSELCTLKQADKNCTGPIKVNPGYIATCEQKQIKIPVIALDKNGTILSKHPFLYAGCWCQVRQKYSVIV